MKYQTLLLDLDDTLLDFKKAENNAYKKVHKLYGIPYKKENYALYHEINDALWKKLELGLTTREELIVERWKAYLEKLGLDIDPKSFNKNYVNFLSMDSSEIDGAHQTVQALYDMGLDLYLITNGVKLVQDGRLKKVPFMKYIKGVCVSETVGAPKPSAEYFKGAEKTFGFKFDKTCLIVGDSLSSDIKGGKNFNLDTVWINVNHKENNTDIIPTYEIDSVKKLPDLIKNLK